MMAVAVAVVAVAVAMVAMITTRLAADHRDDHGGNSQGRGIGEGKGAAERWVGRGKLVYNRYRSDW